MVPKFNLFLGLWSRDAHVFSDVRHHIKARPSDIDMVPINEKKLIIIAKNESQSELICSLLLCISSI